MKETNPIKRGWNRCTRCGKFISYRDFETGRAKRIITPDTHFSSESAEVFCAKCNHKEG